MASLHESLKTHLEGFVGLTTLTSTRIYPKRLPQAPTLPAVTYFSYAGPSEYRHGGPLGKAETFMQIDAWAGSYNAAKAVAEQARLAMNSFQGVIASLSITHADKINTTDLLEVDDAGRVTHHIAQDFKIAHGEAVA